MYSQEFERELPHSIETEQSVLGSIMQLGRIGDLDGFLHEEKFYDARHKKIFGAMLALAEDGETIDHISLAARLQEQKELSGIGGISYLTDLVSSVPSTASLMNHANIIHQRYLHRMTILDLQRQLSEAWSTDSPDAAIANMQAAATLLADQAAKPSEFKHAKDVAVEAFEQIEQRFENRSEGGVTGIPSGFSDLDKMTSGFQRGDLIIVAARPSVGKTAFSLNIAQNAANAGDTVAFFSLEMSAGQIVQRMMSSERNIDANRIRTGFLQSDDWEKLTLAVGSLAESNVFIDDSPALTAQEIAAKCRRLKKQEGLDLIIIDYLQLIASRGRKENRQQEVSEISRTLKQIARELEVPVVALSQLSRAVEQRQDKRPMMSDLRESGSLEQDADIVAFLYRDDYYHSDSDKKNIIEIIISKQRNGPVGTVELVFLKNYNKFVTLDRGSDQGQRPKPHNPAVHKFMNPKRQPEY